MKKTIWLSVLALLLCALLTGCAAVIPSSEAENPVAAVDAQMETAPFDFEIREKMFIAEITDIAVNSDEYIGKAIKLEGMFMSSYYEPTDTVYYMVMRNGPGCCGDDGVIGFEVTLDSLPIETPADNDWVEAVGTLEWYEEEGYKYLRLNLTSLRVLDTRGAETVQQ